jgi:hypothetical protein
MCATQKPYKNTKTEKEQKQKIKAAHVTKI